METLTAYIGRLCAIASLVFVGSFGSFTYQQIDKYSGINHGTWKDGDIMLKGLFPLTFQDGGKCDRLDSMGTTWMMAMIYAVDKINNVSSLLPNKTIGYEIEDTCQSIPKTMSFALEIVSKYRPNSVCRSLEDCCRLDTNHFQHKRISAVIGPASSWISIPVARLLGLYGIPQISYASTSRILADKTRYGSFLRTVPSDQFQAQAMAELVQYFHWNYVFLIASDDDYGKMGAAAFKTAAKNLSVCIANDEFVSFSSLNADRQIEDTMLKLKSAERAEVVIVFSYLEQGEMLLKKAEQFEITDRTWVTSDGWNSVSSEMEKLNISKNTLKGLLSFSIRSKPVTDFNHFLRSTSVQKAWNNSWFTKLLEETLKCQASQNNRDLKLGVSPPRKLCDPGATLPADHEIPTDFVANVIDAVYVVAHALHNILTCNQTRCLNISLPISPETLLDFASKVDFSGVDYTKVKFDKNGERTNSDYVIRNLHLSSKNRLQFIDVGHWSKYGDETRFTVNQSLIQWNKGKKPVSTCFRECQPGEKVVGQSECCWHCQKCDKGQVSFTSGSLNCTACNETHYANAKRTQCIFREIVYLKVSDTAGIVILTLSCLVILVLTSVAVIFVRERRTPVVMDSSPYLLVLFFITLLLSSILTIIHVGCKPTDASCTSTSILLVLVFLFYSSFFLTKTKSATQFLKSAASRLRDMHIAHLQLLGVGVLFLVQSILIIAWQATSISIARHHNQEDNTRLLECYESFSAAHIIGICYPIVVLVVATVLAYRERHLPDNFNEAKSMSFSTLALCILVVAFIPTYRYVYGTNRILVVAFTLFVSAFSCMGCMFVPKLYIIFLRPERNTAESKRETAEQHVTDPGPSFEQATTGSRVSQDLGHVNHGASDGLTNGRKWAVSLSSDNVANVNKRKEEKQGDSAIYQEELLNKGKEEKISNEDEISEVITYEV